MDCTIHVAKTKALISFAVNAKLICTFVFAYAKSRVSHNGAHLNKLWIQKGVSNLTLWWIICCRVSIVCRTIKTYI